MADIKIENVELSVSIFVPGYKDLPDYRDTLHLDPKSTREDWMVQAKARHAAWADMIRNPPAPEPVTPPTQDEVLSQARESLRQAMDAIDSVQPDSTPEQAIEGT